MGRNALGGSRNSARTQVCVTIDVEPTIGGAFANPNLKPLLHEPVAGEVNGRSEALGFILRALDEHGLKATFFVETLHPAYFGEAPMGAYVEQLKAHGQDVQLHLHPCWLTFRGDQPRRPDIVSDQCDRHTEGELIELFEAGSEQIRRWTGERPNCVRTGGFSASRAVFKAIAATGISASSNICVGYAPPKEHDIAVPAGVHDVEGVLEFPVTCFRDHGPIGQGRYRGMQITACARWELLALLEAAYEQGYAYVTIVTHPFEFLKRDTPQYRNLGVNRINQERLRWLFAYLKQNSDRFEVATMSELARQTPRQVNERPEELHSGAIASFLRSAQNVLNDNIRPF